jgi:predicted SAM-dependent methyltransferase
LPDDFFEDGSVREFIIHDVLDHITWVQAKRLVQQCFRWLQENGTIDIHTPNLRFISETLAVRDDHEAVKWLYSTDGEGPTNYSSNHSKWGYTPTSLRKLLLDAGFTVFHVSVDCLGYGLWMLGAKR